MVKLKAPLMSLNAQGKLSKLFSLVRRQGQNIIERRPRPTDAKSPAQLFNRHMFTKCVDLWHTLSEAEKQEWESLARPRHMSGYAWYISQCLRPNPGIYLPLQGGTMSGNIDMAKNRLLKLPDPTDDQEAARKKYVDDLAPGLHAATHENGGADEIDVAGLSGLLADDQHVLDAEVLAVAEAIGVAAGLIDAHALIAAAHHAAFVLADHTAIGNNAPHHARYADAEADARIAIHAAIAAAHHAAFVLADHTAIGDNAPHHARYADAEADARIAIHAAIAAAHHAAFVLADHTAIGDNAPHHARYADDEAAAVAAALIAIHAALPNVHHTPPAAGAVLVLAETEVFNGTSPAAWTDLDLSGTVGSQATLVLLKIYCPTAERVFAVRKNGDTDEFMTDAYGWDSGVANFYTHSAVHHVVLVATDDTGKIEWRSDGAFANTTIDIIAYIK